MSLCVSVCARTFGSLCTRVCVYTNICVYACVLVGAGQVLETTEGNAKPQLGSHMLAWGELRGTW